MEKIILLSNTKAVKNSNIVEVTNFEVVDLNKINIEKLIKKEEKEKVTEIVNIIFENNKRNIGNTASNSSIKEKRRKAKEETRIATRREEEE